MFQKVATSELPLRLIVLKPSIEARFIYIKFE